MGVRVIGTVAEGIRPPAPSSTDTVKASLPLPGMPPGSTWEPSWVYVKLPMKLLEKVEPTTRGLPLSFSWPLPGREVIR